MIPDSALPKSNQFIKADKLGLEEGTKLTLKMIAPPEITKVGGYAVQVEGDATGLFSINKTSLAMFTEVLGRDETTWTGAAFKVIVSTARNPKTNAEVPAFKVLKGSIQKA